MGLADLNTFFANILFSAKFYVAISVFQQLNFQLLMRNYAIFTNICGKSKTFSKPLDKYIFIQKEGMENPVTLSMCCRKYYYFDSLFVLFIIIGPAELLLAPVC